MSHCTVYFRGSDIYVISSAKNFEGIYLDGPPFFRLTQPVSSRELGETVLKALAAYRDNSPEKAYVPGVKRPPNPFLTFAGFRSWRAFEKGAEYFSVSGIGAEVEIMPGVPGETGGFLHQPEKAVRCQARPDQIANCLRAQVS